MIDSNDAIIFYRDSRGIGDAVMLLRCIELYRMRFPSLGIVVVMNRPASAVFEGHPDVDIIESVGNFNIGNYQKARFFNVSTCCVDYEMMCIRHKREIKKSRFQLFAEHCEISWDGKPGRIQVSDVEAKHIQARYIKKLLSNTKKIGICLKAHQDWRTYPHALLLAKFFQRGLFNLGRKAKYTPIILDPDFQSDRFFSTSDLDIRETICLIEQLDLVIGGDSGLMHVAGALGVPTLWLFGPTVPALRATPYPKSEVIIGECPDRPCWYSPCREHEPDCMLKINAWEVYRVAKGILNNEK